MMMMMMMMMIIIIIIIICLLHGIYVHISFVLYRDLAFDGALSEEYCAYRIGISALGKIIQEVCKTIQKQMKQSCLPLLARKAWVEIA
jgi:hypothetical protein